MTLIFSEPIISSSTAHLLASFFAFSYVGSLYISKNARLSFASKPRPPPSAGAPRGQLSSERWRDDPDVIRARLAAVSVASIINCAVVYLVLWYQLDHTWDNLATALEMAQIRLGIDLYFDLSFSSIYPHLLTPVLFLGPLYAHYLRETLPFQRYWTFRHSVIDKFFSWQGVRNYFWAPITEEIVFRSCILSVYHLSGASSMRMIFLGPLSFGLAHIHHAWDTYNRYGRTAAAAKRAIITSCFQLAYTTLFGFHCSYLFLRTSSIAAPITAHIFCNIMGLPEIGYEIQKFPDRKNEIIRAYILGMIGFILTYSYWTPGDFYWDDKFRSY